MLQVPLCVRLPHPEAAGDGQQPPHEVGVRTRHFQGCPGQTNTGPQAEMSLLSLGTKPFRREADFLLKLFYINDEVLSCTIKRISAGVSIATTGQYSSTQSFIFCLEQAGGMKKEA